MKLLIAMIVLILGLLAVAIYFDPHNAGIVGAVIGTMVFVISRNLKNKPTNPR